MIGEVIPFRDGGKGLPDKTGILLSERGVDGKKLKRKGRWRKGKIGCLRRNAERSPKPPRPTALSPGPLSHRESFAHERIASASLRLRIRASPPSEALTRRAVEPRFSSSRLFPWPSALSFGPLSHRESFAHERIASASLRLRIRASPPSGALTRRAVEPRFSSSRAFPWLTALHSALFRTAKVLLTRGFEPPRVSPCAPEAHASASSAT
jgi:hypothetical protein